MVTVVNVSKFVSLEVKMETCRGSPGSLFIFKWKGEFLAGPGSNF
jgi:hypothetical protein